MTIKFSKFVVNVFTATPIDWFCANFVKIGRQEIAEIVHYLHDINFAWLQLLLLRESRPKFARASLRQCTRSAPDFIQICSLTTEL